MPKYKIAVSKDGNKYIIVFKSDSESLARERVHNEGYSILGIEEITGEMNVGNTFIFEARTKSGDLKHGKIAGDDIFKVYVKLKKYLEYDVLNLVTEQDKNLSQVEKEKILKKLEEEYNLLFKGGKKEKIDELRDKLKSEKNQNKKIESFHLKKELEETNKLINFVLIKINNIISGKTGIKLTNMQLVKIKEIYNSIIKLRKSTNISKLKEIGEVALIKIGKIELHELEKSHSNESKLLLKQTNKLLKKVGSKTQFIEKSKDFNYQLNQLLNNIKGYFNDLKSKNKNDKLDTKTHSYAKNQLFLSKYKEKLNQNKIYILKNIFKVILNKTFREEIFLKRKIIKQNITLFKAKVKGVSYSYTHLKKGIVTLKKGLMNFLLSFNNYLFCVILSYTVLFLIYFNLNYYFKIVDYNYAGLFFFLFIYILYLILYLSKNIISVLISFVFLFFIIIFGVINF